MITSQINSYTRLVNALSKEYLGRGCQIESLLDMSMKGWGLSKNNVSRTKLLEIWERDCEPALFDCMQDAA